MILALTIALLIGSAVYLIQQRGLVRIVQIGRAHV